MVDEDFSWRISGGEMKRKCAGFTLVELMVALVIGLLVMAGAIQLFVMTKRTFSEMEGLAARQEAMRFVSDVLSVDIRTASSMSIGGFTPCSDPDADPVSGMRLLYNSDRNPRPSDPYCAAGHLREVRYFSGNTDQLSFCYICGAGSPEVVTSSSIEVLQEGVSVQFSEDKVAGNPVQLVLVGVNMTFAPLPGSNELEGPSFSFSASNRERAVGLLRISAATEESGE
jgi:prepilin-type N-terminal cleavage/methylation domain-containing protein